MTLRIGKMLKKVFVVVVIISIILGSLIILSLQNIGVKTLYLAPNTEGVPSWHSGIDSGYVNLSAHNCKLVNEYSLFGRFQGYLNNSTIEYASTAPMGFYFEMVEQSLSWPYNSTSLVVNSATVEASGGMPLGLIKVFTITGNGSGTPGFYISGFSWGSSWIGTGVQTYVGLHQIYLNITVTPYADYGPYKFAGNSFHGSFEWNVTIGS